MSKKELEVIVVVRALGVEDNEATKSKNQELRHFHAFLNLNRSISSQKLISVSLFPDWVPPHYARWPSTDPLEGCGNLTSGRSTHGMRVSVGRGYLRK